MKIPNKYSTAVPKGIVADGSGLVMQYSCHGGFGHSILKFDIYLPS
jgi:hypothetical protein